MQCASSKASFTRSIKLQEWVLWQQVAVFTFNIYIFKKDMAKINEKVKARHYVGMDLNFFTWK